MFVKGLKGCVTKENCRLKCKLIDHAFKDFKDESEFNGDHAFEDLEDGSEFNDDQVEGRSNSSKTTTPSKSSKTKASSMKTKLKAC